MTSTLNVADRRRATLERLHGPEPVCTMLPAIFRFPLSVTSFEKVLAPAIVSAPVLCTTAESAAAPVICATE